MKERIKLIEVGDYVFEDESVKHNFIGGKIVATNKTNNEVVDVMYRRFHTGRTDRMDVLQKLILKLIPPEEEKVEKE